jgi:hypothetical protein
MLIQDMNSNPFNAKIRRSSLLILLVALGCGGSDALQVTGTVKNADGSVIPNEGGLVIFQPAEGNTASGGIQPDGSFTLMTGKPGDGVKPGAYKVVLQLWKSYRQSQLAVPRQYGSAETTPLEATVDADHTHFDFKVEK